MRLLLTARVGHEDLPLIYCKSLTLGSCSKCRMHLWIPDGGCELCDGQRKNYSLTLVKPLLWVESAARQPGSEPGLWLSAALCHVILSLQFFTVGLFISVRHFLETADSPAKAIVTFCPTVSPLYPVYGANTKQIFTFAEIDCFPRCLETVTVYWTPACPWVESTALNTH